MLLPSATVTPGLTSSSDGFPCTMLETTGDWPNSSSLDPRDRDSLLHKATTRIECWLEWDMVRLTYLKKRKKILVHHSLTFHRLLAWKFLKLSMLISFSFLVWRSFLLLGCGGHKSILVVLFTLE